MPKICPILNARCREAECAVYDETTMMCAVLAIARALEKLAGGIGDGKR